MKNKKPITIKFADLSNWLRIAIIVAWAEGIIYSLAFLYGLIIGIIG